MLKASIVLSVVASFLLFASPAFSQAGVVVNWGAFRNPILDEKGAILNDWCIVQLILDADGDGIDDPGKHGMPSGGDVLIDVSHIRNGSFFPGRFSKNGTLKGVKLGCGLYVRAWNASRIENASYYGDTRVAPTSSWRIDNAARLTLDATEGGSWGTTTLWSAKGQFLWKMERMFSGEMLGSYPNPFRGRTNIDYCVPGKRVWAMSDDGKTVIPYYGDSKTPSVSLLVYDVSGRRICNLTNDNRVPGYHRVSWAATDDSGKRMPAGSYFCRLSVKTPAGATLTATTRMVLLE